MTTAADPPSRRVNYIRRARDSWNADSDKYQSDHGPQLERAPMAWGVWSIPESELRVLGEVAGKDVLELGCGAAQWSEALAEAGARPVGIDLSEKQLSHARRRGPNLPLVHGSAEELPFPAGRFDVVFCDHGAISFADPYRTVPEAARVLRTGGLFCFSHTSQMAQMCWEKGEERPSDRLLLDYFGMFAIDEEDGASVDFQMPYGEWIRLFRRNGLSIEDLIELRPPPGATTTYGWDAGWARRWPAENLWMLRRE